MNKRTITLHIDAVKQTEMRQRTSYDARAAAVGYLATWNMTFPIVDIYPNTETDLLAVYRNEAGERSYTIGAVWRDGRYGFHS